MPHIEKYTLEIPRDQPAFAVLYCRAMILFILQGLAVIVLHVISGWQTPREEFMSGLRLDGWHGVLHLATGVIATYIGFGPPSEKAAVTFTQVFGVFYLLLAFFGSFTNIHFGLELGLSENVFHWVIGGYSAFIGFSPGLINSVLGRITPKEKTI